MANLKKTIINNEDSDQNLGLDSSVALKVDGQIQINVSKELAPFNVNSNIKVENLNASLLDGKTPEKIIEMVPKGTDKTLGIVKLSDSITSEEGADKSNIAASPKAIKLAIEDVKSFVTNKGYQNASQVKAIKVDNAIKADTATNALSLGDVPATKYIQKKEVKEAGQFYGGVINPSSNTPDGTDTNRLNFDGEIWATRVHGAVYNDYAEARLTSDSLIKPGFIVTDCKVKNNRLDLVERCEEDACRNAYVVSDTYGFSIGPTEEENLISLPLAVAGRVLAYVDHKDDLVVGDIVCSNNHGTLRKMSFEEANLNPLAIVGVVSSIPDYPIWGKDTKVDGRVWIKLK